MKIAAIYLAHLNPVTKAHEKIISSLQENYNVYVFPVRFLKNGKEINTKSFPFSYEVRKSMVKSIVGDSIQILPDYAFYAPFVRYLPPLVSPYSWKLRNQIVRQIKEEKFVSYTGDRAEMVALKAYRLNPLKTSRQQISASSVKEMLYRQAKSENMEEGWTDKVPAKVAGLIKENWDVVEKFASGPDNTIKVMGMKFPKEGYR